MDSQSSMNTRNDRERRINKWVEGARSEPVSTYAGDPLTDPAFKELWIINDRDIKDAEAMMREPRELSLAAQQHVDLMRKENEELGQHKDTLACIRTLLTLGKDVHLTDVIEHVRRLKIGADDLARDLEMWRHRAQWLLAEMRNPTPAETP